MGFLGDVGDFFKDAGKALTPAAKVGATIVSVINPALGKPVTQGVEFVADKTGANKQNRPVNPGHPPIFTAKTVRGPVLGLLRLRDRIAANSQKEILDIRPAVEQVDAFRKGLQPTSIGAQQAGAPVRIAPTTLAFQPRRDNTGTLLLMAGVVGLAVILMARRR